MQSIFMLARMHDDLFDREMVRIRNGPTEGVAMQLFREAFDEPFLFGRQQ